MKQNIKSTIQNNLKEKYINPDSDTHYIEFFGIGGSGKSTILNSLCNYDKYVSNNYLYDIRNWDLRFKKAPIFVPEKIRINIGKYMWHNDLKWKYLPPFICTNSDFIHDMILYLENQHKEYEIELNKKQLFLDSTMIYEFGKHLIPENKCFCFDEGFYHKIAVSAKYNNIPSMELLSKIPNPDVIVYISPSIEVLTERQPSDSNNIDSKKKLAEVIKQRDKLMCMAQDNDVKVITIKNENRPENVAHELHKKLDEIL